MTPLPEREGLGVGRPVADVTFDNRPTHPSVPSLPGRGGVYRALRLGDGAAGTDRTAHAATLQRHIALADIISTMPSDSAMMPIMRKA